ncbi:hypothetical protein GCU60_15500 [Blastococcus saxobsidens]|uniref:Uncharacterized protein n=1 Tax=Blastococcus saxobsidens TaxID=138336 RepID=A0A6L9W4V5_9ACTN|nr:hypothetical protein [Blastococcus saxobsidens]NEK87146.1 hypothetical protein [Blastococcus saxobsidens]
MAEPDWNPDTGGRSLAEILREADIESAARQQARRRRLEDDDDTGIRQRRADDAAADRAGFGRRRSDLLAESAPPAARPARPVQRAAAGPAAPAARVPAAPAARVPAGPSTAAIPGLRPDRKPGVPQPSAPVPPLRRAAEAAGAQRSTPRTGARGEDRADPRADARGDTRSDPRGATRSGSRASRGPSSTGPIPVVRADGLADADLDGTPKESALAWLRFGGELLIALAAGVGIYFAATVLWEIVPQLAVFLAPLAVTGLVAGVNLWRQRQGSEPVGARLLAVLVFAGTLLTIAPAASLLGSA